MYYVLSFSPEESAPELPPQATILAWKAPETMASEHLKPLFNIIDTLNKWKGGRQDLSIHLVVEEVPEEIGLTLLMEEAQRPERRSERRY